jgi:hypothetical protein
MMSTWQTDAKMFSGNFNSEKRAILESEHEDSKIKSVS